MCPGVPGAAEDFVLAQKCLVFLTKLREEHTALGFTTAPLKVYDVGFDVSPRRRI